MVGYNFYANLYQPFSSLRKWGLACTNLASQLYFIIVSFTAKIDNENLNDDETDDRKWC